MTTAVVFGASGYTGTNLIDALLAQDVDVIGVARHLTTTPQRLGLTLRTGSLADAAFVDDVTRGADVIAVAVPSEGADGPELRELLPALLQAAESNHARVGVVGGAGSLAVDDQGTLVMQTAGFPAEFVPAARAHAAALEALSAYRGGADWFVLQPAGTYGAWAAGEYTGNYRLGEGTLICDEEGNSAISGADYAEAFVRELLSPTVHRRAITIGY